MAYLSRPWFIARMAEYVNCGFVRSSVLLATTENHSSSVYDSLIIHITETLGITLPDKKAKVKEKLKKYVSHIQKASLTGKQRQDLIDLFPIEKWLKLSEQEKNEHSLSKCMVSLFFFSFVLLCYFCYISLTMREIGRFVKQFCTVLDSEKLRGKFLFKIIWQGSNSRIRSGPTDLMWMISKFEGLDTLETSYTV